MRDHMGSCTLGSVFISRPDECRVAVLQHGDEFWVVDLFELDYVNDEDGNRQIMVREKKVYTTLDAAIVSASINY